MALTPTPTPTPTPNQVLTKEMAVLKDVAGRDEVAKVLCGMSQVVLTLSLSLALALSRCCTA